VGGPRTVEEVEFASAPGLVEPGLERAVAAEEHEPALVWHRLDPVRLVAGGYGRADVEVTRAIVVRDEWIALVVLARVRLPGLQLRSGRWVVGDDRPEVLGRRVGGDVEPVALGPVEVVTVAGLVASCACASPAFLNSAPTTTRGSWRRSVSRAAGRITHAGEENAAWLPSRGEPCNGRAA